MKIIKDGNPKKAILNKREITIITCPNCDAEFEPANEDWIVSQNGDKSVFCPCCNHKITMRNNIKSKEEILQDELIEELLDELDFSL